MAAQNLVSKLDRDTNNVADLVLVLFGIISTSALTVDTETSFPAWYNVGLYEAFILGWELPIVV